VATPVSPAAAPMHAPSLVENELRPLPVPVKTPPAAGPRAITATRSSAPTASGRAPILVPPTRAHRRSGSIPVLRGSKNAAPLRAITAKLCVDRGGAVTSVDILSRTESDVRDGLRRALSGWRYDPIVESGNPVPACFATTFRVTQR
jgi:hypothetical protein